MTSPLRTRRDYGSPSEKISNEIDLHGTPPDTLNLPWGSPPKPYFWVAHKVGTREYLEKKIKVKASTYRVQAPALLPDVKLVLIVKINNARWIDVEVWLMTSHGVDHLFSLSAGQDLSAILSSTWRRLMREDRNSFLKPNIKLATANNNLLSYEREPPKSIAIPWGDPPKPYLWDCRINPQHTGRLTDRYRTVIYLVRSPLILEDTKVEIFLVFNKVGTKFEVAIFVNGVKSVGGSYRDLDTALRELWSKQKKSRSLQFLKPSIKIASSARGKYGYTKKVQNDCERAVAQLKKFCTKICVKQQSKGDKHLEFYRKHAEKTESPFTKAIVQCNKDIYNDALSKIATSMYGFDERTVKVCLANLNAVQMQSASLINRLLARKTSNSEQIKAYLKEHIEQTGCVWSMCLEACL